MKKQGERLRDARERLGMSRNEMAQYVGVSPQTIQNIENGDKMGSLPTVAVKLGLSIGWLETGKGERWSDGGTDEENLRRIKSTSSVSSDESPAIQELRTELSRYREREDRLHRYIDRLLNGGVNFRKALGNQPLAEVG